jgi:PAS domain S-box-containing protein
MEASLRETQERHRLFLNEHARAEEQLRKLSRAIEQCPASIIITDLKGTIEYANPKFCALTGYSLEEVLGKNPSLLKSGAMDSAAYHQLWETILSGNEWRGELHNKKKNGEFFWEFAVISGIKNPSGRITHFVGVKEDITERKASEAEREKLIKELEQALVNVRTLRGLIPICAGCKKIRDDKGFWNQVENYVAAHSEAKFSHGLCPECAQRLYPELLP